MELSCQNKSISLEWIDWIDPRLTRGNPISSSTSFDRGNKIGNTMKEIKLTQGLTAKVDDEDYDFLMQWKWCATSKRGLSYAIRHKYVNSKATRIVMSRLILNTPIDMECDHINHDPLDNRKVNLRNCTRKDNLRNRRGHGLSRYIGVTANRKKWRAMIKPNNKTIFLGSFNNEWAAAIAYDRAAKKYYKEFANLNFK